MRKLFSEGDMIENKYIVEKVLESGENKVVYKCRYRKGYRLLKQIFPSDLTIKNKTGKLFRERCENLKLLDHRNLTKVEDFFVKDDAGYFVVMEQIKGKSLQKISGEEYGDNFFPADLLMIYMLKVCEGLLYMHGKNPPVLYGNLSPATVIVGSGGKVKLVNYGLTNILRNARNTGQAGYSSPEQLNGKGESIKSDVYGMGALMYSLLCGKDFQKKKVKIKSLRKYNKEVSRQLDDLILTCLSPDISKRPDLQEFYQKLSKLYLTETLRKATRSGGVTPGDKEEKEDTRPAPPAESDEATSVTEKKPPVKLKKKQKKELKISPKEEKESRKQTIASPYKENRKSKKKRASLPSDQQERFLAIRQKKTPPNVGGDSEEKKKKDKVIHEISKERDREEKVEEILLQEADFQEDNSSELKMQKPERSSKTQLMKRTMELTSGPDMEEVSEEEADVTVEDTFPKEENPLSPKLKPQRSSKTKLMKLMIMDAIKQKTEEETGVYEKVSEISEDASLFQEKEESVDFDLEPENMTPSDTPSVTSRRSASIASFLRRKSGLADDSYEINTEILDGKKVGSGLSEAFLTSLKASSSVYFERDVRDEKIMEPRFLHYKKPEKDPPLSLHEEIDMLKDNRYETGELLHKDCYGAVYIVRDYDEENEEKETKILKEIQYRARNPEITGKIIKRFKDVCEKLKKLNNPGLARLEDYFYEISEDELIVRLYFIFEYVEGMSFEEVVKTYYGKDEKSSMGAYGLTGIITKVSSILGYLHYSGTVYGDLRPSNLILTPEGQVKCLNYGLSPIFSDIEDEVYPCKGTYGYVAPELKCLPEANFESDIFSLGSVMYFLFTGKKPEEAGYVFQPLREINPSLSRQAERFVKSFLNFTPSNRPDIHQINRVIDRIDFFEIEKKEDPVEKDEAEESQRNILSPSLEIAEAVKEKAFSSVKKIWLPVTVVLILILVMLSFKSIMVSGELNQTAYAIDGEGETIYKFSLPDRKVTGKIEAGHIMGGFDISPDNKYLYFTRVDNTLVVVDLTTGRERGSILVKKEPVDIAVTSKGDRLFIANRGGGIVSSLEVSAGQVTENLPVGKEPVALVLSPDESELYVSNYGDNSITVIDLKSKKSLSIPAGKGPVALDVTPEGNLLYVANSLSQSVSVIDLGALALKATIPLGDRVPADIICSPGGKIVYLSYKTAQEISFISTVTNNISGNIPLKRTVTSMSLSGDKKYLYMCSPQSMSGGKIDNRILVYDLKDNVRTDDIEVSFPFTRIVLPEKIQKNN